jgi:hypothetical protein
VILVVVAVVLVVYCLAGKVIHGRVVVTISRGRVVWEDGKLSASPSTGRFIPMEPFGPLYQGLDKQGGSTLETWVRGFPYGEGAPVKRSPGGASDKVITKQEDQMVCGFGVEFTGSCRCCSGGGGEGDISSSSSSSSSSAAGSGSHEREEL